MTAQQSAASRWEAGNRNYLNAQLEQAAEIGEAPAAFLIRRVGEIIAEAEGAGRKEAYVLKLTDADTEEDDVERMADMLMELGINGHLSPESLKGKAREVAAWLCAPAQNYVCTVVYPPRQPEGKRWGYLRVRPTITHSAA